MVFKHELVQNSVLFVGNRLHGALTVDLVDVNLFLPTQHRTPPNIRGLVKGQLPGTNTVRDTDHKTQLTNGRRVSQSSTYIYTATRLQAPH